MPRPPSIRQKNRTPKLESSSSSTITPPSETSEPFSWWCQIAPGVRTLESVYSACGIYTIFLYFFHFSSPRQNLEQKSPATLAARSPPRSLTNQIHPTKHAKALVTVLNRPRPPVGFKKSRKAWRFAATRSQARTTTPEHNAVE